MEDEPKRDDPYQGLVPMSEYRWISNKPRPEIDWDKVGAVILVRRLKEAVDSLRLVSIVRSKIAQFREDYQTLANFDPDPDR